MIIEGIHANKIEEIKENKLLPISYRQYRDFSNLFIKRAKNLLQTEELFVEVTTYNRVGTKVPYQVSENVHNINLLTKEEFNNAAMVKVRMFPIPTNNENSEANAIATFKDCDPKRISFKIIY